MELASARAGSHQLVRTTPEDLGREVDAPSVSETAALQERRHPRTRVRVGELLRRMECFDESLEGDFVGGKDGQNRLRFQWRERQRGSEVVVGR